MYLPSLFLLLIPLILKLMGKNKEMGIIATLKNRLSKEFFTCFMGSTRTILDLDILRKK